MNGKSMNKKTLSLYYDIYFQLMILKNIKSMNMKNDEFEEYLEGINYETNNIKRRVKRHLKNSEVI